VAALDESLLGLRPRPARALVPAHAVAV
jgi:hypothetical protein